MTKNQLKSNLPYIGIPIITISLFLIHIGHTDIFILFCFELIVVFGYISAIVDIKLKRIPNNLILIMIVSWIIIMVPKLFIDTEAAIVLLKDASLGFLIGGGLFMLVYLVSHKGLGGGDVKFMAVTGLYIGFERTLSTMLYGTIIAALIGLILLILKKIGRKDAMPLAPFLYIGILLTVFFS